MFYCKFSLVLGYILFVFWFLILFYLLGDMVSNYFCFLFEGLFDIFKFFLILVGIIFFFLGNGVLDVFFSMIFFLSEGTKDMGLNSMLGGVFFVFSVVVGIMSIFFSKYGSKISSFSFIMNVLFLLFCFFCLLGIFIVGKINLWGVFFFFFLYMMYAFVVFMCIKEENLVENLDDFLFVFLFLIMNFFKENFNGLFDFNVFLLLFMVNESYILIDYKGKIFLYIFELLFYLLSSLMILIVF